MPALVLGFGEARIILLEHRLQLGRKREHRTRVDHANLLLMQMASIG
jgi:hypothetical protein